MMQPSQLVARAIAEMYGDACNDFDPDCDTCRAWEWFRNSCAVTSANNALAEFFANGGRSMADVEKDLDIEEPKA